MVGWFSTETSSDPRVTVAKWVVSAARLAGSAVRVRAPPEMPEGVTVSQALSELAVQGTVVRPRLDRIGMLRVSTLRLGSLLKATPRVAGTRRLASRLRTTWRVACKV